MGTRCCALAESCETVLPASEIDDWQYAATRRQSADTGWVMLYSFGWGDRHKDEREYMPVCFCPFCGKKLE